MKIFKVFLYSTELTSSVSICACFNLAPDVKSPERNTKQKNPVRIKSDEIKRNCHLHENTRKTIDPTLCGRNDCCEACLLIDVLNSHFLTRNPFENPDDTFQMESFKKQRPSHIHWSHRLSHGNQTNVNEATTI